MQSFSLVLFGATGDLAKIKILPAIYTLYELELLPGNFSLIGSGRTPHTEQEFRDYVTGILKHKFGDKLKKTVLEKMLHHTYYCAGDTQKPEFYQKLSEYLALLKQQGVPSDNRVYHLAILPELYAQVAEFLGASGLNRSPDGWVRIMIEKPFGQDYESAQILNQKLTKYFDEPNIFRLDHYLGKETVMNILAFRFGNGLFEPIWNHKFIDHIQIQTLESFGVGQRGRFYDATGALRDVIQNHILQVLATTLMDRPSDFSVAKVRSERQQILASLQKFTPAEVTKQVVTGVYEGYHQEKDVPDHSRTETYLAMKLGVNTPRWQGVPIYVRTGKKLKTSVSEISIVFKKPPFTLFERDLMGPASTVLNLRLQPNEGIILRMAVKKPGAKMILTPASMDFYYNNLSTQLLEAYSKLLLDAFAGDQTNFALIQEVSAQWHFVDPILQTWHNGEKVLHQYKADTWGPAAGDTLLAADHREWIKPL